MEILAFFFCLLTPAIDEQFANLFLQKVLISRVQENTSVSSHATPGASEELTYLFLIR